MTFILLSRREKNQFIMSPNSLILDIKTLRFAWKKEGPTMLVDRLQVARGERVFLQGASGSGKSTLLSLIGGVASCTPVITHPHPPIFTTK